MKILVFGEFYEESFADHISFSLEKMGFNIFKFSPYPEKILTKIFGDMKFTKFYYHMNDVLASSQKKFREKRLKRLMAYISSTRPELIITTYDYLWAEEVEKIKSSFNIRIVMWSPDSIASIAAGKAHFMNCDYDALFFKDPYIIKNLTNVLGLNAYYLPECFNPHKHISNSESIDSKYECDITTAGNLHSYRVAFFKQLIDKNYDIKIWGIESPSWMNLGGVAKYFQGEPVYNQSKADAFLGAKIVVNNLLLSEIEGVNVRTFEVAGIGGFQLVDWKKDISALFEVGKEIETFRGMGELKEKIDFYLKEPLLRKDIATSGKKRAYSDHTYEKRLNLLLKCLEGESNGYGS